MSGTKKLNWGLILSLALWCFITLIRAFNHSPWYDEAHAWLVSQELNLIELVKVLRIEGHTFLWYLCLMPFAKSNFMYPYSMLLLNWLFCFAAMLILWLKAPFNNWIKFLISFSFPFLALYPVVARCYSIGIMLLFAITAMEKKKLEHPNWYALLLILCANTSLMAMVGATVFGILFIIALIKNGKKLLFPFLIMILGAIIVIFQLPFNISHNALISTLNLAPLSIWFFKSTFFNNCLYFNVFFLVILSMLVLLFYLKNKIFPIFLFVSYIMLFSIFSIYSGGIWHHFFFYIYFIISSWLIYEKYEFKNIKWNFLLIFVIAFVSFCFIFWKPDIKERKEVWNSKTAKSAEMILADKSLLNSNIFVFETQKSIFPIYFRGKKINVINYCAQNTIQWDVSSYYSSDACRFDGQDNAIVILKDDYIKKFYTDNSYLLTSNKVKSPDGSFTAGLKNYKFIFYKDLDQNYLWKVEKIK